MRISFVVILVLVNVVCFSSSALSYEDTTELRKAIISGDIDKIDKLVEDGLDKEIIQSHLLYAVQLNYKHDDVEVIKALIRHGGDVSLTYNSGNTLLFEALRIGDYKLIKLLVDEGAEVKAKSKGRDLLQTAVHITYTGSDDHVKDINQRRLEIVKYLIGLDIFKLDAELLLQALLSSQDPADRGIVQVLINNGLDLNHIATANSLDKNNPFFYAAKKGHLGTIKLFIEHGVNPALQSKTGKSALSFAIYGYKEEVALYLLKNPKRFTSDQLKKAIESAMDLGLKDVSSLLLSYGIKPGFDYVCDTCIYQSNNWPGEGIPVFYANKHNIMLYQQPITDAEKTLVNLIIGERIAYDKTVYRTIKSVMLTARKNLTDFSCGNEKIEINAGDTVEYLQYRAEGYGTVRVKGIICELALDNKLIGLEESPVNEWWIRILNDKKQPIGWYLVDKNSDDLRFGNREF